MRDIHVEDGRVTRTGIVDWTCAGWYPRYCELGKVMYVHQRFQKWQDLWAAISPDYKQELHLEAQMWNASSY